MTNQYYSGGDGYPPPQQGYQPPYSPNHGHGGYAPSQHSYDQDYRAPPSEEHGGSYHSQQVQHYQGPPSNADYYNDEPPPTHRTHSNHSAYAGSSSDSGAYADRGYEDHDAKKHGAGHEVSRGIGATLIGAGSGGFVGHELGGGPLATIGGMIAGAVGANALEHHHKKKRKSIAITPIPMAGSRPRTDPLTAPPTVEAKEVMDTAIGIIITITIKRVIIHIVGMGEAVRGTEMIGIEV
ncbi:hypothetical protein MMC06_003838 [Schaereria dolodes]|nr:hypothetical protein [Schaereria dolodes]